MRLRNRPWVQPLIKDNPQYVVTDPSKYKGRWKIRFTHESPLFLEIGTGKGQFITTIAQKHPENNYIGLEIQSVAIAMALKKQLKYKLNNLQLICANASYMNDYFETCEISGIYLNFSDPWPKKRQEKRRLTNPFFLRQYENIMLRNGFVELKTDNLNFFEYSLKTMNNYGMRINQLYLDLHNEEVISENVITEYENKFMKNSPIYKLIASFN